MGGGYVGWNHRNTSRPGSDQMSLRTSWPVSVAAAEFERIFQVPLLGFVGHVRAVFFPPQSVGLYFDFGPGMRQAFAQLVDKRAFPAQTLNEALMQKKALPGKIIPDDPGMNNQQAWWRKIAAGNAIGASFREAGVGTSLHVAFNESACDVHVDRNGFAMSDGNGNAHWDLNGLLRHMTVDLAGDKAPWLLLSAGYVNARNRPIFQATLSPWLAVDLPSRETGRETNVKVGLAITGSFDL
jgi:hypothetical protein